MPIEIAEAPSVDQALAAIRGEAAAPPPEHGPEVQAPDVPAPEANVTAEDLGPYVTRLMADARHAAEDYRRETEREVADRAAAVFAKATTDAEEIRARAAVDAEATVAAARTRVEALVGRVNAMADELKIEAQALLAPEPRASEPLT